MSDSNNAWIMPIECFYDAECPEFSTLKGQNLLGIYFHPDYLDRLLIKTTDKSYFLYHVQDCCENVSIESITGITGQYGEKILEAIEYCQQDPNASESGTFSFYYLKTNSQDICLRWYGRSNGFYSERVSLYLIPGETELNPDFLLKTDF